MRKKYKLRLSAKDEFQKISGIKTIQLSGSCDCLIIDKKNYKSHYTNQQFAYFIYEDAPVSSEIKVSNTCGVNQCIKKEHLVPIYNPKKENAQYIKDNIGAFSVEDLASTLKIPPALLEDYLKK